MVNLLGKEIPFNMRPHTTSIQAFQVFYVIGYARVSTDDLNLDLQRGTLTPVGMRPYH